MLKTINKANEYKKHPGWEKLLELATPASDHPALISIDSEKEMVH